MKADPALLPLLSELFAKEDDLLAEEFGRAYHKLTHAGLGRCGLSGSGCETGQVCIDVFDELSGAYLSSCCSSESMVIVDTNVVDSNPSSEINHDDLDMINGEDKMVPGEASSSSSSISSSISSSSFSLGCLVIVGMLELWVVFQAE